MFEVLRRYEKNRPPSEPQALAALRLVYILAFGGQLLAAVLAGTVLALTVGAQPAGPQAARVLAVLALLMLPLAPALARLATRKGGKQGALAGAIALGVVLAAPAWFLMLAMLLASPASYLYLMLALLLVAYAQGFVLAGRYAGMARTPEDTPRD